MKERANIIAVALVFILGIALCFFKTCRTNTQVSIERTESACVQTDIKTRKTDDALRRTDEMQERKRPYAVVTAEREAEAQAEVDAGEFDSYMPESRKTAAMIRLSLDDGDLRGVREASRVAAGKDSKLKKSAIAALGWFGGSAVPDLMKFLSDADKDVGAAAAENLERAIDEIDDPDARLRAALDAIRKSSNEDFTAIMEMTAQVSMTEKLESADESAKAFMRRDFVSRVSELISAGKADVAAELFRDVAGTAWLGEDDAVRWADDPNSYEEPEP